MKKKYKDSLAVLGFMVTITLLFVWMGFEDRSGGAIFFFFMPLTLGPLWIFSIYVICTWLSDD